MFSKVTLIRNIMTKRGFKHRRSDDQLTVSGQYVRNLQYVYSRSTRSKAGTVVDLIYFGVDILAEKLVIGFYRENPDIEEGVLENTSRSLRLSEFNPDAINKELDKLILPLRGEEF